MKQADEDAPAPSVPSANRITLLRDADGDGVAETRTVVPRRAELALRHGAGRQRPLRRRHRRGAALPLHGRRRRRSTAPGVKVVDLPAGPINHHWTKNVIASADGRKLYVTVGSNSNVGENGIDGRGRPRRDLGGRPGDRRAPRVRLRPAQSERPGLGAEQTGALWTGGQRARRDRQRPRARLHDLGAGRRASTAGPTATTASTSTRASSRSGPTWSPRRSCPTTRWARTPPRSAWPSPSARHCRPQFAQRRLRRPARLVEPQAAQRLQGDLRALRRRQAGRRTPIDVLTGFLDADGNALRPAGRRRPSTGTGALLVADDVGNAVWRVTGEKRGAQIRRISPAPAFPRCGRRPARRWP